MSAPFSTPDAVKALAMDVKGIAPQQLLPEALILNITTRAGSVEGDAPAVRVPYIDFDAAGFVPEGDAIPEHDAQDREILIHTGRVSSLSTISVEQFNQPEAAALISDAMKRDLLRKSNAALLSQNAPVAPATTPPAGILKQGVSTTSATITGSGNLDPVADAIAAVEAAGGVASHIVVHPLDWAKLVKLKMADNYNVSLLGAGTDAADRKLLSVPVIVDRDATRNKLVVLDRNSILSVIGNIQIATSADYRFNENAISVRAVWRFGAAVADVNRVVAVEFEGSS